MFASYMLNSWIAVSFIALAAGAAGYVVVLRRASFAAHALPMAAFPGAAVARLLGAEPVPLMLGFALASAAALAWAQRRGQSGPATALLLAGLMALGALFLSLSGGYAGAVYALLFGQVLGVGSGALAPSVALGVAVPALLLCGLRPLTLATLSADSSPWLDLFALSIIALAAVAALPITGALLTFSLMTGPAAAARLLVARPVVAFGLSMLLAVAVGWTSLAAAFGSGWPVGFFAGTLSAGVYVLARAAQSFWKQAAQRPSSSTMA
jgi:zinc/manganese transport system permease protein